MPACTGSAPFGFLNIAKPQGVSAHDVVNSVRKIIGIKQIGHAGTLDPMATGVLPIAVGKATRLLRFLPADKVYLAEIKLGITTTTDDITGDIIDQCNASVSSAQVVSRLAEFLGEQMQVPPLYSAIHVGGKRLYELARKGAAPAVVPARCVRIDAVDLISLALPSLTVRVRCSAGTYIRSLARDLGNKLGCGGCLSGLVREQAGPFALPAALSPDELKAHCLAGELGQHLLPPQDWLGLKTLAVTAAEAQRLQQGMSIGGDFAADGEHVVALTEGKLVAICLSHAGSDPAFVRIQPEVVISNGTDKNN